MPRSSAVRLLAALACLAVTGALVGAAPASAATARKATARASATTVLTGAKVVIRGAVTHSPKGSKVKLQRRAGSSWTTVRATKTTTATGKYAATITMPATRGTYSYRAFAPAKKRLRLKAAASHAFTITVRAKVTLSLAASSTSVVRSASLRFTGKAAPFAKGATVQLQRRSGSAWPTIASPALSAAGGYSVTVAAPSTPGTYYYRSSSAAKGTLAGAVSATLTIRVTAPAGPPTITTTSLPYATVNTPYSANLATQSGEAGTWTVSGALPPGVTLNPATGHFSQAPTAAGDSAFTVTFTSTGSGQHDSAALAIHVDPAATAPAQTTHPLVSSGGSHTCRVNSNTNHTLWCWGADDKGQSGQTVDLQQPYSTTPVQVGTSANWVDVSAGSYRHSCGVRADYTLWCWGYNSNGQIGDGTMNEQDTPVAVGTDKHWTTVSAGDFMTCALTTTHEVWCWGDGVGGVGNPAATNTSVPVHVGSDSTWMSVDVGAGHACAVQADHTLWCWGSNYRGQAGQGAGSNSTQPIPAQVGSDTNWAAVEAGNGATCALKTTGTVWCWGINSDGRLGVDTAGADAPAPLQVGSGTTWASITTSGNGNDGQTCARTTTGTLWCWGANDVGQVGDGTQTNRGAPVQVGSETDWVAVSAGGDHTCAVKSDNSQWCWGSGGNGQLGNGLTSGSSTPVRVTGS